MRIRVTAEHIATGCKGSGLQCAVACALASYGFDINWVCPGFIDVSRGGVRNTMKNAKGSDIYRWMADFDNGKPVEPFEFELRGF